MTGSRRQQRGRRILLWMIGIFALVQLGAGLVLDYVVPGVRNPLFGAHVHTLNGRRVTPEIVCVGSSRTGCSIDDRKSTEWLREAVGDLDAQVFNAALPGSDPVTWEPLVNHLLERAHPPRLLVLEMLPESVSDRGHCVRFHIERQLTWTNWPGHLRAILVTNNVGRFISSRLLPLYSHRQRIRKSVHDVALPTPDAFPPGTATEVFTSISWDQIVVGNPVTDPTERLRQGVHQVDQELYDYAPRGPARRALERILARCRKAGLPVLLAGIPVAGPHREKYTPVVEERFHAYVKSLCDRFGVEWCDQRAAVPDSDFADHNHVAGSGCEQFSRRFTTEVLAPRWQRIR